MKTLFKIITISLLTLFSYSTFAQVEVSGEIRPRFEYREGYKTITPNNVDPAMFVSQRSRLNFNFKNESFKVGFTLQDVRVWGDVSQLNKSDVNGTAIHQAWGEILFNKIISLKVGRQEIALDDQRIFGSVGWAQQARSHDAAIIKINSPKGCKINIGIAYNQNSEALFGTDYSGVNNYKALQYLWYHRDFSDLGVSLLFLNNGMAYNRTTIANGDTTVKQEIVYSQTIGTRLTYKISKFDFSGAFYYQMGKNAADNDLAAMYYAFATDYNFTDNFKAGAGFEFLSGNSMNSNSTTDNAFTPFYGTNHKFNGWMDYFYVGNWGGSVGLMDINVPIKYKKKKFSVGLIPHFFLAGADVVEAATGKIMDKNLGTEIDLTIGYAWSKNVNIQAGYSQMFATETLQEIKGGNMDNTNNWAWVMLTFKPTFYKN